MTVSVKQRKYARAYYKYGNYLLHQLNTNNKVTLKLNAQYISSNHTKLHGVSGLQHLLLLRNYKWSENAALVQLLQGPPCLFVNGKFVRLKIR